MRGDQGTERRRHSRVPMAKPAEVRVEGLEGGTHRVELLDLSLGGLRWSGSLPGVSEGTPVTVTLGVPLRIGSRSLRLPAVVLRRSGDPAAASGSWRIENGSPLVKGLRSYLRHAQEAYEDLVATQGNPSHLAESLRMLQVRIGPPGERLRQILITSSVPAEGKSFIAGNLAGQLARDGNRVLLVEADLRQPSLHESFGIRPAAGLAQWLQDSPHRDLSEITLRTGTGLDLIMAGTADREASDSWTRSSASSLVAALRKTAYQFVIIDSPPVLLSAATLGLAGEVDDVLLVVRAGVSREREVREAKSLLERDGSKLRGIVLNDEPAGSGPYGGSYYGSRKERLGAGALQIRNETGESPSGLKGELRA